MQGGSGREVWGDPCPLKIPCRYTDVQGPAKSKEPGGRDTCRTVSGLWRSFCLTGVVRGSEVGVWSKVTNRKNGSQVLGELLDEGKFQRQLVENNRSSNDHAVPSESHKLVLPTRGIWLFWPNVPSGPHRSKHYLLSNVCTVYCKGRS